MGEPKTFNIKVEASLATITNVWLEFRGIPPDWVTIEPNNISSMNADESGIFTVQLIVPRGESGERLVNVVAHSTEASDDKDFMLRIFTSKKDLINFELTRLRARLEELRDRADTARVAGHDTSDVDDLLDDAESEIKLAEGYLKEDLYDPALESIYTAWQLLDEADDLLDEMRIGFAIPWEVLIIIVAGIIIAILVFFLRRYSRNLNIIARGRMSEARQVAGTIKSAGTETSRLREEKGKTVRMLNLLQQQHAQGIISKEAYESLKSRSEQRIAELDKKIRESIRG